MELKGTVRNVASFGAFVDIGLHDDGLLHISKMSKNFVKNPLDIVSVGDIITVYIDNINKETNKVNLSLIKKLTKNTWKMTRYGIIYLVIKLQV